MRRTAVGRAEDDQRVAQHAAPDADADESVFETLSGRFHLVGRKVDGVRIELRQGADYGMFDQRVERYLVDIFVQQLAVYDIELLYLFDVALLNGFRLLQGSRRFR